MAAAVDERNRSLKQALIESLAAILSPDQEVRKQAEEHLKVLEPCLSIGYSSPFCRLSNKNLSYEFEKNLDSELDGQFEDKKTRHAKFYQPGWGASHKFDLALSSGVTYEKAVWKSENWIQEECQSEKRGRR
ncbi:predicted protein [Nematostella vectensis]|uniref:Uncharacterized protein n=1 Tax=Nematostella vectensis TaxID=45351 RepID=A7S6X3_NEMVE|nr:predicted protein [Nematostella vectensis]|eukprot:XP_001632601.1 predicted protein [Nematostella vectensis]